MMSMSMIMSMIMIMDILDIYYKLLTLLCWPFEWSGRRSRMTNHLAWKYVGGLIPLVDTSTLIYSTPILEPRGHEHGR